VWEQRAQMSHANHSWLQADGELAQVRVHGSISTCSPETVNCRKVTWHVRCLCSIPLAQRAPVFRLDASFQLHF
jgi:hypothetical protein